MAVILIICGLFVFCVLMTAAMKPKTNKREPEFVVSGKSRSETRVVTYTPPPPPQRKPQVILPDSPSEKKMDVHREAKVQEPAPKPKPKKTKKQSAVEKKWERENEYAKSFFKDQYSRCKDYSDLMPFEAEEKLERLKQRDGWVDDEVYYSLSRIARGDYPVTEIPYELSACSDEELYEWFKKTFDETDGNFSKTLMKDIGKRLKPFHEALLLSELSNVEPMNVPSWVSGCKQMGYFFSTKVYNACKKKYLSQFEKPADLS